MEIFRYSKAQNMVPYLQKPEGSQEFHQIVDYILLQQLSIYFESTF